MTEVSVIIATYNGQQTLGETLDSVAKQTILNACEVIVVDDGSTDQTSEIARAHPIKPHVFGQRNSGAASALNFGATKAQGKYVAFLDDDDLWEPSKLERQHALLLDDQELSVSYTLTEAFECPSVPPSEFDRLHYKKGPRSGFFISTAMARAEVLNEFAFNTSLKGGFAVDWYHRLITSNCKIAVLEEVMHHRRIRPGTLSSTSKTNKQTDMRADFVNMARLAIEQKRKRT